MLEKVISINQKQSEFKSYGSSFYYTTPAGTRYKWTASIYLSY